MEAKWQYTMDIFDEYERRFAQARAQRTPTHPWKAEDREKLLASVKRLLRFDESLVPELHDLQAIATHDYDGYTATEYRYQSWPQVYGTFSLYVPQGVQKPPLVFVCCGHGDRGRLTESYLAMGHRLAQLGMAALVMDNIGQGDRCRSEKPTLDPDHWAAVAPFACGLTLQGLIVAEMLSVIRYMQKDPRFDAKRFAACGNSGGGTLTMFLAALAPELCAIASCGYPSELQYVMQKERRHCACNLLVGQAWEAEMWEIYSLFAPKPLLLCSGVWDDLFPIELFQRNARKVRNTYMQLDAPECFCSGLTKTRHSWELEDINLVSGFLARQLLQISPEDALDIHREPELTTFHVPIPKDSLTTAQLCQALTGRVPKEHVQLQDVFPPAYRGKPIDPKLLQPDLGRGDVMRVFAQFECALYAERSNENV